MTVFDHLNDESNELRMKKIFTFSILALISITLFSACTKRTYLDTGEDYWLSQERGQVVYSSQTCDYYVVQTYNGYEVIRSWDGFRPFEGTILYGNFSTYGTRNFYDPSSGTLVNAEIMDYWLSYAAAQDELSHYCN
jgi:hypothetical protein